MLGSRGTGDLTRKPSTNYFYVFSETFPVQKVAVVDCFFFFRTTFTKTRFRLHAICQTASSDVSLWLGCILGNVGGRSLKAHLSRITILLHCWTHYGPKQTRDTALFIPHILLSFQDLLPTLPMMLHSHCVTPLETIYQITCSSSLSHKWLYTTF